MESYRMPEMDVMDVQTPRAGDDVAFTEPYHMQNNSPRPSLTPLARTDGPVRASRWTAITQWVPTIVVIPGMIAYVHYRGSPAIMTMGAVAVAICGYEFGWLAFRIRHHILSRYERHMIDQEAKNNNFLHAVQHRHYQDPLDDTLCSVQLAQPRAAWTKYVTAGMVALVIGGSVTGILNKVQTSLQIDNPEVLLYTAITYAVTGFAAALAPTWSYGLVVLVQVTAYSLLAFDAFFCAAESPQCYLLIDSSFAVTIAMVPITILRIVELQRDVCEVGVTLALDMVGVVYLPMLWRMFIVTATENFQYDRDMSARILTMFWGCELGAMVAAHGLHQLRQSRRLPSRIRPRFPHLDMVDMAGGAAGATLAAWGAARVFPSMIPEWQYVVFAALATPISRYGRMFVSMVKQLAETQYSGRPLPGLLGSFDVFLFMAAMFTIFHRLAAPDLYSYDAKCSLASKVEALAKPDQEWVYQTLNQIIRLLEFTKP